MNIDRDVVETNVTIVEADAENWLVTDVEERWLSLDLQLTFLYILTICACVIYVYLVYTNLF